MQFCQGKQPKYIPYVLSDKVIDWKSMWFYVRNLSCSLSTCTPGPPVRKSSWNSKGSDGDQVNFLLEEIERLKADHWSMRRIQPLQQRVHLGFQYTGGADPSCYSRSKITEDDLKDRVLGLLKNVAGMANIAGTFSAGGHPREVLFSSSRLKCSSSTFCRVVKLIQYLSCRLIPKTIRVGLRCPKMCH